MFSLGTPRSPLREGVTVNVKGVDLVIAPLNMKSMAAGCEARRILRGATTPDLQDSPEAWMAMVTLAGLAVRMNYDVSDEALADWIDDAQDLRRILEASSVKSGEARAPMNGAVVKQLTTSDATGTNLQ